MITATKTDEFLTGNTAVDVTSIVCATIVICFVMWLFFRD